tara:strand:+ start:1361 stop:1579 length:219 start_codon:yes stop_codon:yes gene_type:complete
LFTLFTPAGTVSPVGDFYVHAEIIDVTRWYQRTYGDGPGLVFLTLYIITTYIKLLFYSKKVKYVLTKQTITI